MPRAAPDSLGGHPPIGDRLVIASHNPGKLREIADLVAPYGVGVVPAGALGLPEPEETEDSFAGNAVLKARAAAAAAGLAALADDSGLVVTVLDGQPGIYSARWAGPDKDFRIAMQRVEDQLRQRAAAGNGDRGAHFVCALAVAWPDGEAACFEGRANGTLIWPPRGERGFGYDPMFLPLGQSLTFGEMDPEKKHAMSHRARAFAKLVAALFRGR
jgi:XTP/dITP diphosphohydrolase